MEVQVGAGHFVKPSIEDFDQKTALRGLLVKTSITG